jgi:hypothetical protein
MTPLRWVGVLLVAGGLAMSSVGLVGALSADEQGASTDTAAETAETTTDETDSPEASPSADAPEREDPEDFYELFETAFRGGDGVFLFRRLHPEVLARYGDGQCRSYTDGLELSDLEVDVLSIRQVESFVYETDGMRTSVGDAYRARVRLRTGGSAQKQRAHLVYVDDELRWFTDCGDPN